MVRIRVCIGSEPRTEIARRVLESSIRRHAGPGVELELHRLWAADASSVPRAPSALPAHTGFSLLRWTIPERFGFEGKAIYLDADQLCRADLAELWDSDRGAAGGACLFCTTFVHRQHSRVLPFVRRKVRVAETSVALIDCAAAKGRLRTPAAIESALAARPTAAEYDTIMHARYLRPPPVEISRWWNVMDRRGEGLEDFADPRAKILHFTRIATQPWRDPSHPARGLWEEALAAALADGDLTAGEIAAACAAGLLHGYWSRYAG